MGIWPLRYPETVRGVVLILLLCGLAQAQQAPSFTLGSSVEHLELDSPTSARIGLPQIAANRPVLLLFLPADQDSEPCRIVADLGNQPPAPETELIAVWPEGHPWPPECAAPGKLSIARSRTSAPPHPGLTVLLIDDSLHVRWRFAAEPGPAGWRALQDGVALWRQGRQVYEVNCGHCHGFDGAGSSSPDVKTLVGITRKYPEPKVLELGSQFGGVDMTGWSSAKKEALLTYLRGL